MSLDGWSNINNEPVLAVCVTEVISKKVFLTDTIDTTGQPHTGQYLKNIAVEAIKKCSSYQCKVSSFVTDNAANMVKMRSELNSTLAGCDVITYGCASHFLNLFALDMIASQDHLKEKVKKVMKYFKYTHSAMALLKELGGLKPKLPSKVRWNSLCDTLQNYLDNWPKMATILSKHRQKIPLDIIQTIIEDIRFKKEVDKLHSTLSAIAIALDTNQKPDCSLSQCLESFFFFFY